VTAFVVGWDGNIDELSWGVGIAKSNNGDVDVGSLLDSLGISARIGDNDKAGFLERAGDVVGEVTRGETTSNWGSSSVCGELQDSALTVGTSRDNTDIGWVVDGCDNTGSKDNLLPVVKISELQPLECYCPQNNVPGLADVDDVDSIGAGLPEVWLRGS